MFASLQHPGFRILWTTNVLAGVSQWAMLVGRAWLVFELSESALSVALITFSGFVGSFLMVPLGGVLADRLDRRNLMLASFVAPLVINLVLAAITISGFVLVWHVVVLSFLANLTRSVGLPAGRALAPSLVPAKDLLNAVSLSNVAMRGPRLIGPLLAVPLLATIGVEGIFVASGAIYMLAAINLFRLQRPARKPTVATSSSLVGEFSEGMRFVLLATPINLVVGVVAVHCALTMSFDPLLPTLAKQDLGGGGVLFTYLFMAVGTGGLLGTLGTANIRSEAARGRYLLIMGLFSGISLVLIGISGSLVPVLFALGLAGASQSSFMSISEAMILETAPDRLRGRAMGVYFMIAVGVMALAGLTIGYLGDLWAVREVFLTLGVIFTVAMAMSAGLSGRLRRVYRFGSVVTQAEPAVA